jgi:hypothetical protein
MRRLESDETGLFAVVAKRDVRLRQPLPALLGQRSADLLKS